MIVGSCARGPRGPVEQWRKAMTKSDGLVWARRRSLRAYVLSLGRRRRQYPRGIDDWWIVDVVAAFMQPEFMDPVALHGQACVVADRWEPRPPRASGRMRTAPCCSVVQGILLCRTASGDLWAMSPDGTGCTLVERQRRSCISVPADGGAAVHNETETGSLSTGRNRNWVVVYPRTAPAPLHISTEDDEPPELCTATVGVRVLLFFNINNRPGCWCRCVDTTTGSDVQPLAPAGGQWDGEHAHGWTAGGSGSDAWVATWLCNSDAVQGSLFFLPAAGRLCFVRDWTSPMPVTEYGRFARLACARYDQGSGGAWLVVRMDGHACEGVGELFFFGDQHPHFEVGGANNAWVLVGRVDLATGASVWAVWCTCDVVTVTPDGRPVLEFL